jgi:hypothetical protein
LTRAINATTGQEIWTISDYPSTLAGPGSSPTSYAIADGFTTFFNRYDNQIYAVSRGPSSTTVQAPLTAITVGGKAVMQGTVIDVSAGTKQNEHAGDFPKGVPCASDMGMKDWMGCVYQQRSFPTNFAGVPVSINALDPNGNYIHMGDASTNSYGLFHYTWATPNVPGDYSVYASFPGTNG